MYKAGLQNLNQFALTAVFLREHSDLHASGVHCAAGPWVYVPLTKKHPAQSLRHWRRKLTWRYQETRTQDKKDNENPVSEKKQIEKGIWRLSMVQHLEAICIRNQNRISLNSFSFVNTC